MTSEELLPSPEEAHANRRKPLARLGESIARRPWIALGAWIAVVLIAVATAVAGVTGENLFDRLTNTAFDIDGETADGEAIIAEDSSTESVTLLVHGVELDDPALAQAFAAAASDAAAIDPSITATDPLAIVWQQVTTAHAPWDAVYPQITDPGLRSLFADDDRGALLTVDIQGDSEDGPDEDLVYEVVDSLEAHAEQLRGEHPDTTVEVGSATQLVDSVFHQSEEDLKRGEMVALPIALVIMLIVFGGFIAAGLPLILAGAAIASGLGILYATTHLIDINTTVINVVTAVGLGLSIDYGLLMVSRFREEFRARGELPEDPRARKAQIVKAVGRTVDTAGRTAAFSGTMFALASAGLLVFEPTTVKALGVGALIVAAIGVVAAGTLMPALLAIAAPRLVRPGLLTRTPILGPILTRFGDVAPEEGIFSRLTRFVQKVPILVTAVCAAGLIWLGSPLATLTIANTAVDVIPESSEQYPFFHTVREQFPAADSPRIALVARDEASLAEWSEAVGGIEGVKGVEPAVARGEGFEARVDIDASEGVKLVPEVRDARPAGVEGWTVGQDSATYDLAQSLGRSAPWAMLLIGLSTFIFLFLATGSFLVPIKALIMSALSLGAAVGVLVWGFEDGHLAGVMNFDASQIHGVDIIVLLLALVFGFGLAMDYEMFILSRIIDLLRSGVDAKEAIARGLQRSGRIITSAALIIIVVFAGFATGDLPIIKGLGVALACAVLLDATIVRMLLVPAIMSWGIRIMFWAPKWAKRLHARIGLSE